MHFQFETNFRYRAAQKRALKQQKKDEKQGNKQEPEELSAIIRENTEAERVELGVMDIPTDQIIGVAEDDGKNMYAADFMPVSFAGSNYAYQWRELCMDYRKDKEFFSPLHCYEYLGKFYVIDGKKRVSVLKYLKAPTACAYVTRILPVLSEEKHIQIYYEFLESFKLTKLYQISFSQLGSFKKLQKAMGHTEGQAWTDEERKLVLQVLARVAPALDAAFGGYLNVTPADALLVLLEECSLKQIRKMTVSVITDRIQRNWKKLYSICHPDIELCEDDNMQEAS